MYQGYSPERLLSKNRNSKLALKAAGFVGIVGTTGIMGGVAFSNWLNEGNEFNHGTTILEQGLLGIESSATPQEYKMVDPGPFYDDNYYPYGAVFAPPHFSAEQLDKIYSPKESLPNCADVAANPWVLEGDGSIVSTSDSSYCIDNEMPHESEQAEADYSSDEYDVYEGGYGDSDGYMHNYD